MDDGKDLLGSLFILLFLGGPNGCKDAFIGNVSHSFGNNCNCQRKPVRIFLQGYLYAVTQHLLTRRFYLFFKFPERFLEISCKDLTIFSLVDNSNHLKDLVIHILWTLVMSFSNAQAMILTVILTVYQTQQL